MPQMSQKKRYCKLCGTIFIKLMNPYETKVSQYQHERRTNESPVDELIKPKLSEWLNYPDYVEGMRTVSSRLSLSVIEYNRKNREGYVASFVTEFIRWYSVDVDTDHSDAYWHIHDDT